MTSTDTTGAPDAATPRAVRATRLGDGLAQVTLARPARRNAISPETVVDLRDALADLASWGTRVAVLDAEGPAFCAGADLADLAASAVAVDEVVELVATAPVCWVAAVRGAVRGAGVAVLDACPVVVAEEGATFGLPELARGFFPSGLVEGALADWPRRTLFGLAFTAAPVDARRAETLGIVTSVVAADELDQQAREVAERIAAAEPEAVAEGVRLWQRPGATLRTS